MSAILMFPGLIYPTAAPCALQGWLCKWLWPSKAIFSLTPCPSKNIFWEEPAEVSHPLQVTSAARLRGIKTTTGAVTRSLPLGQTPPAPALSLLQELERLGYTQINTCGSGWDGDGGRGKHQGFSPHATDSPWQTCKQVLGWKVCCKWCESVGWQEDGTALEGLTSAQ